MFSYYIPDMWGNITHFHMHVHIYIVLYPSHRDVVFKC